MTHAGSATTQVEPSAFAKSLQSILPNAADSCASPTSHESIGSGEPGQVRPGWDAIADLQSQENVQERSE